MGLVAGVATLCSPSMRPLAGHPHAVGLATHPPCDSTQHACAAPFLPFLPVRTLCLPARRRLSRCDPCALAGQHGMCGQLPTLPAASSATVHMGEVGLASVHVAHTV